MKYSFTLLFSFFLLVFIYACKGHTHDENHSHDDQTEATIDKSGKEYTSAYVCPMHCEGSGAEAEGTCPVCGMAYVKNEDLDNDEGASHDHDGKGDDHSHGDGDDHDHDHDH